METKPKILLVDDEESYRDALKLMLEFNGFDVIEAETGKEAIEKLKEKPDAILLDLILPDLYGLEVLKGITAKTDIPTIILSVKDGKQDIDDALSLGAVDYVIKPNKNDEQLIVKLNHLINKKRQAEREEIITIGNIRIYTGSKIVMVENNRIHLTDYEYKILELLVRNPNKVLGIENIIKEIWGEDYTCEESQVRGYIKKLRDKLEEDAANPKILVTERTRGYILVIPK
ncbi:MAG: hypothetical protein A2X61_09560 [Ignavibacteria bacterium GWB2_35_12]|nr:MAG: hypothetical protein A2X61_09560 [Ignavibacteria bacterium GWB2_35_12]OGU93640.1 MAG: hypothetical protein A2220_05580 [Ignavibacteria bacterium RIFOXYA2_FULL_35_10]OGV23578.1 MAG: hypothetical protein A2475_05345 [Ignavibacteria bacterium RIFOXYC2_FULL_35_21]